MKTKHFANKSCPLAHQLQPKIFRPKAKFTIIIIFYEWGGVSLLFRILRMRLVCQLLIHRNQVCEGDLDGKNEEINLTGNI